VLNYVGLADARYRNVETYSTGMKQRLKLAQALVHDPKLLLLDEPTNGMDPRGRTEMLALVRDVATTKNIPVVLSSHLLPDVEFVCTTVLVLSQGEVAALGEIDALKRGRERTYLVRVKGDGARFASRLREGGATLEETGPDTFRVVVPDGDGPDAIVAACDETGLELRRLVPDRASLEDVFLGTMGEKAGAR
jgi:ABC-2 type transport system ATP-binding protein